MADPHFRLKVTLSEFGQSLFMPEESDQKARQKINDKIFEKLRQAKLDYTVNRTVVFGSAEKRTGLWVNMDYDCVVILNVKKFPESLQEVKLLCDDILPKWQTALSGTKVERKPQGLQFMLDGVDLDILVGFNATKDPTEHGRPERQVANVLEVVKNVQPLEQRIEFARHLSTSLVEKGVDFIKTKSSVTNEVARVAKLWVQFAGPLEYKVSGKSTLIELICVEAMSRITNQYDILEGFKMFLALMIGHKSWQIGRSFLEELDWDEYSFMSKTPFIIDPSNPYNNMYNGPRVKKFLKEYESRAAETLHKINQHRENEFDLLPRERSSSNTSDWLVLLKLLYVQGSDERHGIKSGNEPQTLKIAMHLDKVEFNSFSGQNNTSYTNLMRFICYHAAFIPRNVKEFDPYVDCLQKALKVNTNVKIEKTSLVRGPEPPPNMVYPVKWCNGIWVGV